MSNFVALFRTLRLKKLFTIERPYRCHDCGWRGWLENIRYAAFPLPQSRRPQQ